MALLVKKDYQFDGRLKVPTDQASPANRDIWIDTASGKLAFRIGGVDVLIPLPSELGGGGGLTTEQAEDIVGALIQDNADLDWTYDDPSSSLVAVIKASAVANSKLADMTAGTMKGRAVGAGTGAPTDLTASQIRTIIDFVNEARASISVSDTSTLDLSYASGVLSGAVLNSPLLEGSTKAQIQSDIIAAISGGASSAYDTLVELQAFLQADDTALSGLTTAVGVRARFYAGTVPNGSTTATITHNLGLTNIHDFTYRVFVAATGAEEEYAAVGTNGNSLTLTDETGANIASGRRIFVTAGV